MPAPLLGTPSLGLWEWCSYTFSAFEIRCPGASEESLLAIRFSSRVRAALPVPIAGIERSARYCCNL
jgi:hypothetical protein